MKKLALIAILLVLPVLGLGESVCVDPSGNADMLACDAAGNLKVGGTGATSLGKEEDTAYASGDTLVGIALCRNNAPTRNVDGATDYMCLQGDTDGKLWIAGSDSDGDPYAAADRGMVMLGVVKDNAQASGGSGVSDGDYTVPYMTANREFRTTGGQTLITITQAITVDTNPYAAGDYINDADTITSIANIGKIAGSPIRIVSVMFTDLGAEGVDLEAWFFGANPSGTTWTDNAAFDIADADLTKVCCVVPITSHFAAADNGVSLNNGIGNGCICDGTTTTKYMAVVAREAVTFDAANVFSATIVAQALTD